MGDIPEVIYVNREQWELILKCIEDKDNDKAESIPELSELDDAD